MDLALAQRRLELLRLQARYQSEVRGLSRSACADTPKDLGERGAFEESEAKRLRDLNFSLGRLCGVDRALKLMGEGWKGACVDCDGKILDVRIRAIPWATRCTVCAEMRTPQPVILHTRHGCEVRGFGIVVS